MKTLTIITFTLLASLPIHADQADEVTTRLRRLPNIIDMPYNKIVQKSIDEFCTEPLKSRVGRMLGEANIYMPFIEEALEAEGLPLEIRYLPVVESRMDPEATSNAGAAGLWQLMVTTAHEQELEVNSLVDERRDPMRSSQAAAKYLKTLYRDLGDWTLALAAYNVGASTVNKAIARSGGVRDFWKLYPYLPKETREYVPKFIAANYIMTYYCKHGITPTEVTLPTKSDTVRVRRKTALDQVAAVCGIGLDTLQKLNPQYRAGIVPEGYALRLAEKDITTFLTLEDSVYSHPSESLQKASEAAAEAAAKAAAANNGKKRYSTVRRGDTLSAIAQRNGTTVARLRSLNGIRGNNIRIGQRLRVR